MQKHRTHQIDESAQHFLQGALPSTWVLNKQEKDYAKDFLVEIGESDGELTGSNFFIQLKGTEKAELVKDGSAAKFYLESKYAKYYLDKVTDLPVFLVIVDITEKKGWWQFLQPILDADEKWRKQNSVLLKVPIANDFADIEAFKKSVIEAKKWMRQRHPESIHDAVMAHKLNITRLDPRFDVKVSLENDRPHFHLLPKQPVPLKFTLSGERDKVADKLKNLIDKGIEVAFLPGELKVTGSKLFERIETEGCKLQTWVDIPLSVSLVCLDENQNELARLGEIPGKCSGGQKELWFEGALPNSPVSLKIGPIAAGFAGSVRMNVSLSHWNGQSLKSLAYFDRLHSFFSLLPQSVSTSVEFCRDGNAIKFVELPFHKLPFVPFMSAYLESLWKARKVAERFSVNPLWSVDACDEDTLENIDQMYAIFFNTGWNEPMPKAHLTAECYRKGFRYDILKKADKPGNVRLESTCTYKFFDEEVEVGKLVHEYSEMVVELVKEGLSSKGSKKIDASKRSKNDTLKISVRGSEKTILQVRTAEQASSDEKSGHSVLSERSKVKSNPTDAG